MPVHIGYAAMLERFPPAEAVLARRARRVARVHGRDGHRPLPAVDARAGRVVVRVERARRDRRTHDGRPRPGRDDADVPDASGRRRPGQRDARRPVPGPALARHRLGRGAQRARRRDPTGPRRPSASTACSRPSTSSRGCSRAPSPAATCATPARTSSSSRRGCGRCRAVAPEILVAASGPVTARRAGRNVDGFITDGAPTEKLATLLTRIRRGRARGRPQTADTMPKVLQLHLSWAATDEEAMRERARRVAERGHALPAQRHPLAVRVRADSPARCDPRTSTAAWSSRPTPTVHRAEIQRCLDAGFDRVYLHNAGRNQARVPRGVRPRGAAGAPRVSGLARSGVNEFRRSE